MTHLEEQLKRIHLSPAQEAFFRKVGFIDTDQYFETNDTTAAERMAAIQLAKDVLAGKPLYQINISTVDGEKKYAIRQRQLKLDLGGYVYTDNWAVSTLTFSLLFGVAMKTVIVNNSVLLDVAPEGNILFNEAMLTAQCNYVEAAFAELKIEDGALSDILPMVFAYVKATLLIKQKVRIPQLSGEFNETRLQLAKYVPKRKTWNDYLQFLSKDLPFDGVTGPIDMLVNLTDITVDSLPGTEFFYRTLGNEIVCLRTMQVSCPRDITDGIFNSPHSEALLTPELLRIDTPEREQQLYDLFKFYHKG
ncbi:hypothetical protein BIZ82_gp004 [Erwinia phage vB_EamM_EarlPhillipIV]|uniref:Uncharacterized protein n=1 Tax=Erwinia phage vB_EamM_EarlPhillipIV TaxID=1883372 RepID=A0A1B2ICB5_9CAUD|nr:hypothetical protein BIZ82_gp004 [Erwinia phage vB_EamM_EarlPhillipIV]ANZ48854.1 hypothetical protein EARLPHILLIPIV_4 [Erwinia phage vB_EamM_EarlPhillipIV]